jgi:hypothetical protein
MPHQKTYTKPVEKQSGIKNIFYNSGVNNKIGEPSFEQPESYEVYQQN